MSIGTAKGNELKTGMVVVGSFKHLVMTPCKARTLGREREYAGTTHVCFEVDGFPYYFNTKTTYAVETSGCVHEWVTDSNGLVDQCANCGELRA